MLIITLFQTIQTSPQDGAIDDQHGRQQMPIGILNGPQTDTRAGL
jgi:hypothetical protein